MDRVLSELDSQIMNAFHKYMRYLEEGTFRGREREAVSLFSFGFLIDECCNGKPLFDKAQVGIEVAIPQMPAPDCKPQVCKDIVIWPEPRMVCWDNHGEPSVFPLAVMEWKVNQRFKSQRDLSWLVEYTSRNSRVLGYRVHQAYRDNVQILEVDHIFRGAITLRNVA